MKTYKPFFGFMIFFCFGLVTAQEEHKISILIDTKNATPENAIQWSTGENTKVLDSGEQGPFTFFAQVGDHIYWDAMSLTEPGVPVDISSLRYVTGPRIFSNSLIKGNEETQATVIRGGKDYYIYELTIQIGNSGRVHKITSRIRVGD